MLSKRNFLRSAAAPLIALSTIDRVGRANAADSPAGPAAFAVPAADKSYPVTPGVAAEFRTITDKPVRAVIYTAFHVDHINGVKAFVSAESVKAGQVAIIAHETLMTNVIRSSATIGPILGVRTA